MAVGLGIRLLAGQAELRNKQARCGVHSHMELRERLMAPLQLSVPKKLFRYLRDPGVSLWRKLAGVWAALYVLSPIDAIPDFIPVIGWLDDIGVVWLTAFFIIREV